MWKAKEKLNYDFANSIISKFIKEPFTNSINKLDLYFTIIAYKYLCILG